MLKGFVVCASALCVVAHTSILADERIRVTLECAESEILTGQPLPVVVRVANPTDDAIPAIKHLDGDEYVSQIYFQVAYEDQPFEKIMHGLLGIPSLGSSQERVIPAQGEWAFRFRLLARTSPAELVFPKPGRYSLRALFPLRSGGGGGIAHTSNAVNITVNPPKKSNDLRTWRRINGQHWIYFLQIGRMQMGHYDTVSDAFLLLHQTKETPYHPAIRYALKRYNDNARLWGSPHEDRKLMEILDETSIDAEGRLKVPQAAEKDDFEVDDPADVSKPRPIFVWDGKGPIYSMSFSPDGKLIAVGCRNRSVTVWDVATGDDRFTVGVPTRPDRESDDVPVKSVWFSPETNTVSATSTGNELCRWRVKSGKSDKKLDTSFKHWNLAPVVTVSKTYVVMATASEWDVATLNPWTLEPMRYVSDREHGTLCVSLSPDTTTVATGGRDSRVRIRETQSLEVRRTLRGHDDWVFSMAFAPDGKTLVSGSYDGTVRLWDLVAGEPKRTIKADRTGVLCVAISPDGGTIATSGYDGFTYLWNAGTGSKRAILDQDGGIVLCLAFSPDGRLLATGDSRGVVNLWSIENGK